VRRTLLSCVALAALALPALAEQPVSSSETLIQLTVHPAAAPKPALRYLLLPELREMNPGNPIQNYLKCFAEQQTFFFNKETVDRREKLLTTPLKDLPVKELEDYGGNALRQADWAARLDKPDWQVMLNLKRDGVNTLLPDLQEMRMLANALKLRFRAEVALGRFDLAIRTAKTMFALARHLGEHPTFIGDLVGLAVANVAIGPLEEMLEQPGCPNLYWALTNLPDPLVRLDIGAEGERTWVLAHFHDLPDNVPMSEDQLKKFIAETDPLLRLNDGKGDEQVKGLRAWLDQRNKNEELLGAARRRLVEVGLPEKRVKGFPADQVLLLDQERQYEVRRDDLLKLLNVPYWQLAALPEEVKGAAPRKGSETPLFYLEPATDRVRAAQVRLEQRIGLLRHVEALRMYAADHDAKLPEKLADCSVPLPKDPFTGKPFRYEVTGTTAHLRGTPPPGREKEPAFNVHYEVTIQK
jgi:hypothetical protein